MSQTMPSRSLLLEQLETRCLLAGGLFSSAHSLDEQADHRRHPTRADERLRNDRPAELRVELASFDRIPRDGFRGETRPSRPGRPPTGDPLPVVQMLIVPVLVHDEPSTSRRPSIAGAPELIIRIIVSEELLSAGSDADRALSPGSAGERDRGRELETRSLALTATSDTAEPVSREFRTADPSAIADLELSRNERIATDHSRRSATDSTLFEKTDTGTKIQPQAVSQQPGSVVYDTGPQAGLIETFPLFHREPLSQQSSQEEPRWELERETLHRLRDVTRPSDDKPTESTDAAIAGWFQGPGGLIDIETDGTPLIAGDATATIVDIVLDATFGLHRSLDIAAWAESTSSDETIRDAILAAIAGEQADTAALIDEPSATKISALGYSGAALPVAGLVAGSLAIAGRRRHRNAIMTAHATRPTKPD